MCATPQLTKLIESKSSYQKGFQFYLNISHYEEELTKYIDKDLPGRFDRVAKAMPVDHVFRVLSVGGGNGRLDSRMLTHLRETEGRQRPRTQVVVVEPAPSLDCYRRLVASKGSEMLRGIEFEWRQQTFLEYAAASGDEDVDKFHFISCLAAVYYLGDLDWSIKLMYDRLCRGGFLLLTTTPGDSGWGRWYKYLQKTLDRGPTFCTSDDVRDACGRQGIPIAEIQTVESSFDISVCFEEPLSDDGRTLLDFLAQTQRVAESAPPELLTDMLRYLREECSGRGAAGQIVLDDSMAVVIIQRH